MLRRRSSTVDDASGEAAPPDDAAAQPVGKGRPTPKRRDAERRRRTPLMAPKSGKEARQLARAQARERQAAMRRGDERALPARDRGPVRRFARDLVDSRRNAASYFLPVAVLVLLLDFARAPVLAFAAFMLMFALTIAIVIDSAILMRRLRREVARRFPGESARGLGFYTITRALQIRRLRFPPARVKRGDRI